MARVRDSGSGPGVDALSVLDQIVSGCYEKFDPPWEPKFILVPLDDGSGRSVIVIKVDPSAAPRPLLMDMKAPIRLSGRNASADRDCLLALAREDRLADAVPVGQHVTSSQIPQGNDGSRTADFIFRTGINVPIGEAAAWRPLSERALATLTQALNNSPLPRALPGICHGAFDGFHPFRRAGFNRSRGARLAWHAGSKEPAGFPVEAVVTVMLPDAHAASRGVAQVQIDVISRMRGFAQPLRLTSSTASTLCRTCVSSWKASWARLSTPPSLAPWPTSPMSKRCSSPSPGSCTSSPATP